MLCRKAFTAGGVYATPESGRHERSKHHLFPKRFKHHGIDQVSLAGKLSVDIQDLDPVYLCYECHEVLLENPVFTTKMVKELSHLIKGENLLEGKVIILSRVIQLGLREAIKEK